jgi:hypothetical protein
MDPPLDVVVGCSTSRPLLIAAAPAIEEFVNTAEEKSFV